MYYDLIDNLVLEPLLRGNWSKFGKCLLGTQNPVYVDSIDHVDFTLYSVFFLDNDER